ncbi:hypothetical protein OS493_007401 [Desmophyllum pertusum]|uniref:Uncharacterized protein n=1 Tax=Desmophyllum pertusum TaxID=174260 RepID=A0A9W9Z2T6_9CNID|nr:hypothetical protein OS493_007401 [Desmophyllum pertusum]
MAREVSFFLQNHESPEDWAELYYNYGSVWLAYMSMIPDDERNAQARNTAEEKQDATMSKRFLSARKILE